MASPGHPGLGARLEYKYVPCRLSRNIVSSRHRIPVHSDKSHCGIAAEATATNAPEVPHLTVHAAQTIHSIQRNTEDLRHLVRSPCAEAFVFIGHAVVRALIGQPLMSARSAHHRDFPADTLEPLLERPER